MIRRPSFSEAPWMAILSASSLVLAGCRSAPASKSESEPAASVNPSISFEGDIRPLFAKYCIECHGVEAEEAGLDLRTSASTLVGGDSGPVIVPGQPEESLLFEMIRDEHMPPDGDLPSPVEIETIRRWIAANAPP